jgi:hypothetical protein
MCRLSRASVDCGFAVSGVPLWTHGGTPRRPEPTALPGLPVEPTASPRNRRRGTVSSDPPNSGGRHDRAIHRGPARRTRGGRPGRDAGRGLARCRAGLPGGVNAVPGHPPHRFRGPRGAVRLHGPDRAAARGPVTRGPGCVSYAPGPSGGAGRKCRRSGRLHALIIAE